VAFASWIIATLALLIVAGAHGRMTSPNGPGEILGRDAYTVREALARGIGGPLAGAMFLSIGLASLAPTCYAAFIIGHRFSAVWPRLSRLRWTLLGAALAWLLIAARVGERLETVFTVMGALFAPMAGALASDYVRSRGAWRGPRRGLSVAGLVSWIVGVAVGLVPIVGAFGGPPIASRIEPASVYAFFTAFGVNMLLAGVGLEPPVEPLLDNAPASQTT
jgi:cytosine permease